MAQIRQYNRQVSAPGPVNLSGPRPNDLLAAAAGQSNLGQAAMGLADALQKRADRNDVSALSAQMAQAQADLTVKLQERVRLTEPGDDTLSQKALEDFDAAMGPISESITTASGRRYFEATSASMRAHYQTNAYAGQSDLAGVKARQDYSVAINGLSSSALADPTSFNLSLSMHRAQIENLVVNGGLSSKEGAVLLTEGDSQIARAAVRGTISRAPDLAKQQLDSGEFDTYFDGNEKKILYGEIDQEYTARRVEAERQRADAKRVKEEQQLATQNDFLVKMNNNQLSARDILNSNLEAFGSGSKDQFLRMMNSNDNSPIQRSDPALVQSLFDRIHLPDGDPQKITDENFLNQYFGRGLNKEFLGMLRGEMQGKKTQEGAIESELKNGVMTTAKHRLTKSNPLMGIVDPVGDEQYQRWMSWFLPEYQKQRQAGKSARALTDPTSPEYMGQQINNYVRTPEQILNTLTNSMKKPQTPEATTNNAGPLPPGQETNIDPAKVRKPGESAKDYLERMKAGK